MRPDPASKPGHSSSVASRSRAGLPRLLSIMLLALFGLVAHSATASALEIHVKFGKPYQNCTGFGLCRMWIVMAGQAGHPTDAQLREDKLVLSFQERLPEQQEMLPVEVPLELDTETARSLGVRGLVVLPGHYPIDYSSNPNGEVVLNVQRTGIVIDVEVGRRSRDCRGFGICSITVGWESVSLSDRRVRSVATFEGDKLHLEFGERLPEQGDSLTIDEDIVLDEATARKGGAKWCEVLSGTYRVDYSNNPNGSVDIPVNRIGIGIEINVGRRTADGDCRPGFGICSIVIHTGRLLDHTTAGIATIDGDKLSIDFLSQHPDRSNSLVIDQNIELDEETARGLGAERAIIAAGVYPVDYSDNPNGTVELNVMRFGITIYIEVGRRSKSCTGFGICSISVGAELNDHSARVRPSMVGPHTLRLKFVDGLPQDESVMPVDEAITLGSDVAKAMGEGEMTILPGEYKVVRSADGSVHVDVSVVRHSVGLQVKIGRKSQDCWNFGICAIRLGHELSDNARIISATSSLRGSTLKIAFSSLAPDRGDVLTIDEAITLDEQTAAALGSRSLTILPGRYRVDYSDNPFGTVELRTQRFGITIGIDVGRRSKDCHGLGICSITIGLDFSARTVPSVGSIEDGKLHLVFGKALPESGDEFVVEQDVELSPEQARGLGHGSVTLKRGLYRISTDDNGVQSVDIDVAARGITITIHIGRRGCTAGFGICRITTEASFAERAVMAVADVENGILRLDFLGETLDREQMMVFEEDFELDTEILIALGLDPEKKYSIRRGAYAMDSSDNEYGTLQLETGIQGGSAAVSGESGEFSMKSSVAPNPATSATTIRFTLPKAAPVTVTIVDAQGQQVMRPLENMMMSAGEQSIGFDATSLPAGAYHYTIETGTARSAGTVVVVK